MPSIDRMESWDETPLARIRKSHFRGVYRSGRRWKAQIQIGGEQHYLGTYDSEESAARAYDVKAKELRGKRASTNFDEHGNETLESLIRREKLRQVEIDEDEATAIVPDAKPTETSESTVGGERLAESIKQSPTTSVSSIVSPATAPLTCVSSTHSIPTSIPLFCASMPPIARPPVMYPNIASRSPDVRFLSDPAELRTRLFAVSQSLQHAREAYDFQCKCVGARPDLLDPFLDAVVVLSIQYDDILERLKRFHQEYL